MLDKAQVVSIIRMKGPILPVQLGKEIGGNSMIAGAVLSELVQAREVKISNAKVGGSPVYYTPGQEPKLTMLYDHLHEKEKKAYEMLKEKRVLRDKALAPVERVALREIKDFASPIEVNLPTGKELFWRWYLTSNSDAEMLIKKTLGIEKPKIPKEPEKPAVTKPITIEEPPKVEPEPLKVEPKKVKPEQPKVQKNIPREKQDFLKPEKPKDDFLKKIYNDFEGKNVEIKDINIIRKNSEIDMILKVPSAIGDVDFFCKARNKKKNNDGDLSSTFLQGQLKKLPTIYLTTGEMTKKAIGMLDKEFKGLLVIKL